MNKNGKAAIMAPPGAPGAATIAIPSVIINGTIVVNEYDISFIINTAVTQLVMVIVLPIKCAVAQNGITKSRILADTPFFSAISKLNGIVAADDCNPTAAK